MTFITEEKARIGPRVVITTAMNDDGGVDIIAYREERPAQRWYIATIDREGLRRIRGITDSLGFPADDKARIRLIGEDS